MGARDVKILGNAASLEESGRNLFLRAYSGGNGVASDMAALERDIALGMLRDFEASLRGVVRGKGGSIAELVEKMRRDVERGITSGEDEAFAEIDARFSVFKDRERTERDRKRVMAVTNVIRAKVEANLAIISVKGADAAVSYALRTAHEKESARITAEERLESTKNQARSEKESLELRLSRLNGTLRDAVTKFVANRKTILEETAEERRLREIAESGRAHAMEALERAEFQRDSAIQDRHIAFATRDQALEKQRGAEKKRQAAEEETARAKRLYERVANRAAEADRIAESLKKYGHVSNTPALVLETILAELARLRKERVSYQQTTARNFALERQVSQLNATTRELETQISKEVAARKEAEASNGTRSKAQLRSDLADSARSFFAVMARMDGSDPERQDYADYDR
ncbi:MAG: hypothetical protein QG650_1019, partial [Patescibacteria group bacterium]|nr:hypothetical protein [Patescibacteria group bacterium]